MRTLSDGLCNNQNIFAQCKNGSEAFNICSEEKNITGSTISRLEARSSFFEQYWWRMHGISEGREEQMTLKYFEYQEKGIKRIQNRQTAHVLSENEICFLVSTFLFSHGRDN